MFNKHVSPQTAEAIDTYVKLRVSLMKLKDKILDDIDADGGIPGFFLDEVYLAMEEQAKLIYSASKEG